MSNCSSSNSAKTQPTYACREDCSCAEETTVGVSELELLQNQTGNVLVTLGALFAESPIFRNHIDKSTANMLVSLGRKLKRK